MSPSIAKREKLFGPLQLALIAVLFAVSFFYLVPKQDAFIIAEPDALAPDATAIGELDLAYLKARHSSGKPSLQETSNAVVALVRSGQIETAQQLLEQQPESDIGLQQRYSLDLEMARVNYFASEDDKQREFNRLQLLNRITLLLDSPELRTNEHLIRAVTLTEQLDAPKTTAELYELLGNQDSDKASDWFTQCATRFAQLGISEKADRCFDNAIAKAESPAVIFEIRLNRLAQPTNNPRQKAAVLSALQSHQPLSVVQSKKLAQALLANEHADLAFLEYEKLATRDKPNRKAHLLNAAKWAEASNNSVAAASYVDQASDMASGLEKVQLLERAEALLIAAGENEAAFVRLKARMLKQPENESLLLEGIARARALGKVEQAAKWNEQLVNINPTNIDGIQTQIELALAERDLSSAAKWSRQAVALKPDSRKIRTRHAQISEWNGNPVAALKEWQWLARNYPEQETLDQLVRLAELNRKTDVASAAMRELLRFNPNDEEKISRLVLLYELEGAPISAAAMLNELQLQNGVRAFTQRELARLYQRHVLYPEALVAWSVYADAFGETTESTLNRMELHWRLNSSEAAAQVAQGLIGTSHVSEATPYQLHLLSEIAWRYRMPELAQLVKPHIEDLEDEYQSVVLSKRLVQSLEDAGRDEEAVVEATRLWQNTGSTDIAFTAMNLAFKTGRTESVADLLTNDKNTEALRKKPAYWQLAASIHQKNGQSALAVSALEQALKLDPENVPALSGLLWAYIDANDINAMATFIEQHQALAESQSELWSPFAIAHLQLGLPELSLTWFDRQLDRIEADYNMLLTFADALEYAGRAEPARKVRIYAIQRLRPVIAQGASSDKDDLLRQYAQLLNRYGSADDKERLAQWMLKDASERPLQGQFWREDIAISWLMATQRHEHARLVMAKLHEQRLQAPAWQALAVAMASEDVTQIRNVLNGTGKVSVGNHILALRQLGKDKEAYRLAQNSVNSAPTLSDQQVALNQVAAMRSEWPSFTGGKIRQTSMNGLGVNEAGFSLRQSFVSMNFGLAVDYTRRSFTSNQFFLGDNQSHDDIALSLHHGNRRFGGFITAGFRSTASDQLFYGLSRHHLRNRDGSRTVSAELAYNESSTDSAVLRLAAKQNRIALAVEQTIGAREYIKLQADARDITTRVQEKRIARGLSARMEVGIRGAIGSNVWSTSVAASRAENDVVKSLPAELALSRSVSVDNLISTESSSLSLGASLSRGGVGADYPQVSSPRYYLNANVGHTWPEATFGAQFDAGAGIRVLGGDELSVGFSHDSQPFGQLGKENDTTSFGVNYRYHF